MRKGLLVALTVLLGWLPVLIGCHSAVRADEAPMMTKEELKPLIGNPDVIIIDIRFVPEWRVADLKIKGAVREEPMRVGTWIEKYPKDKTIVLYCA